MEQRCFSHALRSANPRAREPNLIMEFDGDLNAGQQAKWGFGKVARNGIDLLPFAVLFDLRSQVNEQLSFLELSL